MIKFEDISVDPFVLSNGHMDSEVYSTLVKYRISNCQQLYDLIKSENPDFDLPYFKRIVTVAYRSIKKLNKPNAVVPKLYRFELPEEYLPYKDLFDLTDKRVLYEDLQFSPFTNFRDQSYFSYDVATIKRLSGEIDIEGKNALHNIVGRKSSFEKVIFFIRLYDKQLLRVASGIKDLAVCRDNLFTKDLEEKCALVEEKYGMIIDYFLGYDSLIFSNSPQKFICTTNPRVDSDFNLRRSLVKFISLFCTLEELEGDLTTDTLKRFVIGKKKR